MLVRVKLPKGKTASIEATSVIRIRPSFGDYEQSDTVFIDYVSSGVFSIEPFEELKQRFGEHIRLAQLNSPVSTPVLLNADGIAAVVPPNPALHHELARSVAMFTTAFINPTNPTRGQQQLRETEAQARTILNRAAVLLA
jgi:hypothetical protein